MHNGDNILTCLPTYSNSRLCRLCVFAVVPVRKVHALNITWALPPQEEHYRWAAVLPASRTSLFADRRESDELKYSSSADCGEVASVLLFFLFCSSFNVSTPLPPPPPCLFFFSPLSEWSLSTTSLGWLATKAQEASSLCWGRSEFYCVCARFSLIWGHSKIQLKGLQFAACMRGLSQASSEPLSVAARSSTCAFFFLFFLKPLDGRFIHALPLDDVAAREHFKPLVTKWQSEPPK